MSWLIELGSSPPKWWTGKYINDFSEDSSDAIRFERFEDSERARLYLVKEGYKDGSKSMEHIWIEK